MSWIGSSFIFKKTFNFERGIAINVISNLNSVCLKLSKKSWNIVNFAKLQTSNWSFTTFLFIVLE